MAFATVAFLFLLSRNLSSKKCASPFDSWMIIGLLASLVACRVAFAVCEPITFTVGKAHRALFMYWNSSLRVDPVIILGLSFIFDMASRVLRALVLCA